MASRAIGPDVRDDALLALAMLLLGIGVFIGYPLVAEDTANPCIALQRHVVNEFAGVDDSAAAENAALERMPSRPSFVSCTARYWRHVLG